MKLNDREARRLVELRISGLTHRQAMDQIRQARGEPKDATPAQKEQRRRAAAALLYAQTTGCTLSDAWIQVMTGTAGDTTSEKKSPNSLGTAQKSVGEA